MWKAGLVVGLMWLGFIIGMVYGWVMNLITLVHTDFTSVTGEIVVRIIGVPVFPVGAIMGIFF